MDNNNEYEADAANVINAINDDDNGGDLFERIYLPGQILNNVPDVPFRLVTHSSVTEIHQYACLNCTSLTAIVFHEHVTAIGRHAFAGCRSLPRVELPEGLLRLEERAFYGCKSLREIVIPASVQFIGHHVFAGCTSLVRVVFAPRTTSIELGSYMFIGCSNLRFVTLPPNLPSIPAYFLCHCTSLTHLQLPASVEQFRIGAFEGSGIHAIAILENDENIPDTVMLPPNLQVISECCFHNCQSLTNIRIPDSVQQIEEDAFSRSGLRSIEIPETVQQIDQEACADCSSLERVTMHSSNNLIMANDIFANCPSLSVILMYQWLWPKLFVSMNGHPDFILKFFRQYQTQIFDFETPTDVISVWRLFRRLRRDRRR